MCRIFRLVGLRMMTRRFTAALALLAFAGANAAVALHYGHHHEHQAVVLRDAAAPAASHCSRGRHSHSPASAESGEPGRPHPPRRLPSPASDDHCLICQSLANKPLPAIAAVVASEPQPVAEHTAEPATVPRSAERSLHLSRGPPAA
jgi:hypothetical protein